MTILKDAGEPGDDTIPEFLRGAQFCVVEKTTQDVSVIIRVKGNDEINFHPPEDDSKRLLSSKVFDKFMQIRSHKIDERTGRGDSEITFTSNELDGMLDEACKEVVEAPR